MNDWMNSMTFNYSMQMSTLPKPIEWEERHDKNIFLRMYAYKVILEGKTHVRNKKLCNQYEHDAHKTSINWNNVLFYIRN